MVGATVNIACHRECGPESVVGLLFKSPCCSSILKGFMIAAVDCKSALLAINVHRIRQRKKWSECGTLDENANKRSMICFCKRLAEFTAFIRFLCVYARDQALFFTVDAPNSLLKFGNVYEIHVLPPNESLFSFCCDAFFFFSTFCGGCSVTP